MNTRRSQLAAVVYNEVIYAIGGKCGEFAPLATVEAYSAFFNSWRYVRAMNIARYAHAAYVLQGKIYVVGGLDGNQKPIKEIECYEPLQNKWFIFGETSANLCGHSLVSL